MMRTASLLLAAAVLIVAVSGAGLYHRFAAPMGWQQVSPAPANAKVTFHVGLRQTNLDELERRFWAISDPMSDEHQNFMSIDEINELVAPKPQHKSAVYDWLIKSGVNAAQIIDYSDDFEVSTTVAIANKLFSADLFFFKHEDTGKIIINAMGTVSIPDHLMEAISIVTGITTFPHPHLAKALNKSKKVKGFQQVYENDAIIPQTIWNLYGIPSSGLGGNPVSQGVIEFEGQTFTNDDLLQFGLLAGVTVVNVTNIVGPNTHSGGEESSLDIQMVAGVNPTSTNWFWLEDGENWLYEFGQHYFATTNVPQIASISYGWYEGAQCQIDGNECTTLNVTSVGYVQAVDVLFQKIQARGLTLVVSSGDSGAHTRSDEGCSTGYLLADYPGTSPYITSVGATEVVAQTFFPSWQAPVCTPDKTGRWNFTCVSNGYEVAVDVGRSFFTSGGGFSNISATPSYQQTQVTAYLNQRGTQIPPVAMFNTKGRGRPDLSAVGHNAMIVDNGGVGLIGGTSQSSPIIAAIMALLTNEYIKITGKPFGFLNQFLYQMYAAAPNTFNDVIAGDNICPEYGCSPTCRGFIATYGWDPVTGLGTPNYPNMLAYVQKLGANVVARREARAAAAAGKPAVVPRRDQTKFTSA